MPRRSQNVSFTGPVHHCSTFCLLGFVVHRLYLYFLKHGRLESNAMCPKPKLRMWKIIIASHNSKGLRAATNHSVWHQVSLRHERDTIGESLLWARCRLSNVSLSSTSRHLPDLNLPLMSEACNTYRSINQNPKSLATMTMSSEPAVRSECAAPVLASSAVGKEPEKGPRHSAPFFFCSPFFSFFHFFFFMRVIFDQWHRDV